CAVRLVDNADGARFEQRRVFFKTGAANQMRLLGQIAQIVIKTPGTGILTVDDLVQPLGAFAFRRRFANLAELLFEPEAVVKREVYRVEVRAAPDRDGLILFDAELHADALK